MSDDMAIRFSCQACAQPIEVDEEWASRPVICPYCRKTVTAPAETTLVDVSSLPVAKPLEEREHTTPSAGGGAVPTRQESSNSLAIVAAVLVTVAIVFVFMYAGLLANHAEELETVMQRADALVREGHSAMGAAQHAWMEYYEEQGGVPPDWLLGLGLIFLGFVLTWLGALVCSIIACRRRRRRGLAIAALVASCLLPLLFCGTVGVLSDSTLSEPEEAASALTTECDVVGRA